MSGSCSRHGEKAQILRAIALTVVAVISAAGAAAAQEDLNNILKNFGSLDAAGQHDAAMKIFKNYNEYKNLKPWEISPSAARA